MTAVKAAKANTPLREVVRFALDQISSGMIPSSVASPDSRGGAHVYKFTMTPEIFAATLQIAKEAGERQVAVRAATAKVLQQHGSEPVATVHQAGRSAGASGRRPSVNSAAARVAAGGDGRGSH